VYVCECEILHRFLTEQSSALFAIEWMEHASALLYTLFHRSCSGPFPRTWLQEQRRVATA
jgi:hypothetical protein